MSSISPHTEVGHVKRYRRGGKPYGSYFGFYRFPDEATEHKVNLKIREKRFAEQRLREVIDGQHAIRTCLAPSDDQLTIAGKPLAEYIEDYIASMVARELKPETIRKISPMLRRLFDECGWRRLADLSASQYEIWRGRVDLSAKSKNHYLHTASAFSNWLIANRWLERNPFNGVRPARVEGNERRPRRALTVDEIHRLILNCPSTKRRMIYELAFGTGARESEMRGLWWSDFDLNGINPTITYRIGNSKSKKAERNPIPYSLAAALAAYMPKEVLPSESVFPEMDW